MTITGRCLCGDIRFSIEQTPTIMGVCHCKHCQRQSGSAFSTMAGVPTDQFHLQRGTLTTYQGGRSGSGNAADVAFCGRCGTPVYTSLADQPDLLMLKTGTLDDTDFFEPQFHVWCDHKQRWVTVEETTESAGTP